MRQRTIRFLRPLAVVGGLLAVGVPVAALAPTTTLVSVNSAGTDSGNNVSFTPLLSADGQVVAFESEASDLVANDTNKTRDVFVRDIKKGTTTLVSVNSAGTDSGNNFSVLLGPPSADGRLVAFESEASDLVANDTNGTGDVFVRDLKNGTTTLVSVNSAGTGSSNGFSFNPVISADGRMVAFTSFASDLVANDTNGTGDVFVRDLKNGTTTLVSVNSAGTGSGNGFSIAIAISANGQVVAFTSVASDLVANDTNGRIEDVFARNLKKGTTTLVSVNSAGTGSGNSLSFNPVISADGRAVAFQSDASDLVANDTNGHTEDIFVRNLKNGKTKLVSVNSAGTGSGNNGSFNPTISADGRVVAFQSGANDLVANDTSETEDVFVRDVKKKTTTLVSINSAGTGGGNEGSFDPQLSANGQVVAFVSSASDLVTNDSNAADDVFVRDLKRGTTTLASSNSAGTDGGNRASVLPVLSTDGQVVAFQSSASDLVANDTNGVEDVFAHAVP